MFCPPKWKYETRFDDAFEISSKGMFIAFCPNEDNAKLIAKAPELVDLLERILIEVLDERSTLDSNLQDEIKQLLSGIYGGLYYEQ